MPTWPQTTFASDRGRARRGLACRAAGATCGVARHAAGPVVATDRVRAVFGRRAQRMGASTGVWRSACDLVVDHFGPGEAIMPGVAKRIPQNREVTKTERQEAQYQREDTPDRAAKRDVARTMMNHANR